MARNVRSVNYRISGISIRTIVGNAIKGSILTKKPASVCMNQVSRSTRQISTLRRTFTTMETLKT